MQFRDDVESSRGWSQSRDRDPMPLSRDDHRRLPHFDSGLEHDSYGHSPYHPNPYYSRGMPPLHHKPPPHSPMHGMRGGMPIDAPPDHRGDGRSSNVMDESSHGTDASARGGDANDGKSGKDGPLLLLALPQDRISLSETLCVVREVRLVWYLFILISSATFGNLIISPVSSTEY